ncbi:MAG: HNH endonuclease, partial [Candidatus Eisenbacteria sp.]|nr:HNH endonuclease [Candidatus Eisenbacteria bacterium]
GTNDPENLTVLCSACHKLWHDKKLDGRLLKRVLE